MTADDPIFVIGYQRSGTTLLQSMLGAHAAIAGPPEIYFFMRIAALSRYYGDLNDDHTLRRVIHDTLDFPLRPFDAYGLDEDAVFEAAAARERTYGNILLAVMGAVASCEGKRRWSEKSPGQRAGHVLAHIPNAKLVHIVRDIRDVVASASAAPWLRDGARRTAAAARQHVLESIAVGRRVGPRQYTMVRYEDLTSDPEAVLRQLCAFIGEDFDPTMLDPDARAAAGTVTDRARPWQDGVTKPVTTDRQGSWRTRLSRADRARVAAVVHRELPALGYEPASRKLVLVGSALNTLSRPADVRRALDRWRVSRRGRSEGPEGLKRRLRSYLDEQMAHLDDAY